MAMGNRCVWETDPEQNISHLKASNGPFLGAGQRRRPGHTQESSKIKRGNLGERGSAPNSELTARGPNWHFQRTYSVLNTFIIFLNLQNHPARSVVLAPFYK